MAAFKEITEKGKKFLVVLRNDSDTIHSGIKLQICPPMYDSDARGSSSHNFEESSLHLSEPLKGSRGELFYVLRSSIHTNGPRQRSYVTLGRRIIEGDTQWGPILRTQGAFGHVDGYWEWLEDVLVRSREVLQGSGVYDALYASLFTYARNHNVVRAFCEAWCPETNTIHTTVGEMSISLMDLWRIGGLPIAGDCYEEVIPSLKELTGLKDGRSRSLPESCTYLFAAYLRCQEEVYNSAKPTALLTRWIEFWCKRPQKYFKPVTTTGKRTSRTRRALTPDGIIGSKPRHKSKEDDIPFAELQVKENLKDETYLAAFIACWLCLFVLPSDGSFIRPSTFKMASLIAHGRTFSLAVPVLVSIYRGLNKIAYSSTPERTSAFLPWHYIVGWTARYLNTHDRIQLKASEPLMVRCSGEGGARSFSEQAARDLVHGGSNVDWPLSMPRQERAEFKVDDGRLSSREKAFFIAVRSALLVLHNNGSCWVEPYSPCRFARQFGFYQIVPQELGVDSREVSLEEAERLWSIFISVKCRFKLTFPLSIRDMNNHVSGDFMAWWSIVHGSYMIDGRPSLITTITRTANRGKHAAHVAKAGVVLPSSPRREPPPLAPCNAPKVINKDKEISANVVEKRLHNVAADSSSSATPRDVHWKRQKPGQEKAAHCLEETDLNSAVFFDGVQSQSQLEDVHFSRLLDNQELYVAENPAFSERSTNGPNAFFVVAQQGRKEHALPTTVENTGNLPFSQDDGRHPPPDNETQILETTAESEHEDVAHRADWAIPDIGLQPVHLPSSQPLHILPIQHAPITVSQFNPGEDIPVFRHRYAEMLWGHLRAIISSSSIESLSSKKKEIYTFFDEIGSKDTLNLSGLKNLLDTFYNSTSLYCITKQQVSEKLSETSFEAKQSDISKQLKDAEGVKEESLRQTQSLKSQLAGIKEKREELHKQLNALKAEETEVGTSLDKLEEKLESMESHTSRLRHEMDELVNTPLLLPGESETLEKMKGLLERQRKDLIEFKIFP